MADIKYLKDNLTGFVPTPTAAEIIQDVTRGIQHFATFQGSANGKRDRKDSCYGFRSWCLLGG